MCANLFNCCEFHEYVNLIARVLWMGWLGWGDEPNIIIPDKTV